MAIASTGINMGIRIKDIISTDSIALGIECKSKDELIKEMIELASRSGKILNKDSALKEVFDREKVMSTGVGKGIALPHAKTNAVSDSVGALVTLKKPVDFDSIDNNPVNLVFLLLGRENNVNTHLKLLSNISRLVNSDSIRNSLLESQTVEEIIEIFDNSEQL